MHARDYLARYMSVKNVNKAVASGRGVKLVRRTYNFRSTSQDACTRMYSYIEHGLALASMKNTYTLGDSKDMHVYVCIST